jgi:hypothetical protein
MISISQSTRQLNPEIDLPIKRFQWFDSVIIVAIFSASALTLPALRTLSPDTVSIFKENRCIATYPLNRNDTISVTGTRGEVEIVIHNGTVAVTKANCPHGICMKTGAISAPHAQIVCAPNRILVSITSFAPDTIDAVAR